MSSIGLSDVSRYLHDGGSELINSLVDVKIDGIVNYWYYWDCRHCYKRSYSVVASSTSLGSIAFLDVLDSGIVADCLGIRKPGTLVSG